MKEFTQRQPSLFEEIIPSLPLKLKQARIYADLTQQELSSILGCSHSTIAMYESGKRQPSIKYIVDFCQATETNISWLFDFSDQQIILETDDMTREQLVFSLTDYFQRCDIPKLKAIYILLYEDMYNCKFGELRGGHIPGSAYIPGKIHDKLNKVTD